MTQLGKTNRVTIFLAAAVIVTTVVFLGMNWKNMQKAERAVSVHSVPKQTHKASSTEEVSSEHKILSMGDVSAFVRNRDGFNEVVLVKKNTEYVLEKAQLCDDDCSVDEWQKAERYTDIAFSPLGTYLTYTAYGYEWSPKFMFNVKTHQKITGDMANDLANAELSFMFTPDESFFALCSSADMASESGGKVYDLSNMRRVFDLFEDPQVSALKAFQTVSCDYASEEKETIFRFYLSNYDDGGIPQNENAIVSFNVRDGKVKVERTP